MTICRMDTWSSDPFSEILKTIFDKGILQMSQIFKVLLAFKVQVCAKTETRGLEMAFLVRFSLSIVSAISQLFQGEPNGI